jgi:8-oxo-dGTP diphosphatase
MWCVPTALVYACRGDEDVLVLCREKAPNLGLWVAPGGKIEPGESPYETAQREFMEETGLQAQSLRLRGLCTLTPLLKQHPWFIFIYVTHSFKGSLKTDCVEGALEWVPLEEYLTVRPKPAADAIFAPHVLTSSARFFQAKFVYDAENALVEWTAY